MDPKPRRLSWVREADWKRRSTRCEAAIAAWFFLSRTSSRCPTMTGKRCVCRASRTTRWRFSCRTCANANCRRCPGPVPAIPSRTTAEKRKPSGSPPMVPTRGLAVASQMSWRKSHAPAKSRAASSIAKTSRSTPTKCSIGWNPTVSKPWSSAQKMRRRASRSLLRLLANKVRSL